MPFTTHLFWLLLVSVFLTSCGTNAIRLPEGVSPVQATWLYGRYSLPASATRSQVSKTYTQTPDAPTWTTLAAQDVRPGMKIPVVLYMHGCAGFSKQDDAYRQLLFDSGYAVFMPDSFKRPGRQKCREEGTLMERVSMRLDEVEYALGEIRKLPWVDQQRIILMGFSEGGNTVDHWAKPGFAAHIILGSACTLIGGEPAAPAGIPVLAIVGEYDEYRPGLSCKVSRTVGGSRSIVIPNARHKIADKLQTHKAIKAFLRSCCI